MSTRKSRRRTNQERTESTRSKLIRAAIQLLLTHGHAATTTARVARRARVSRGTMLHHFPSRADLMAATAEYIEARHREERIERLSSLAPWDRLLAATDVSWELQERPESVAQLEIMMASLGDRALRERLEPLLQLRAQLRREAAAKVAADLGLADESRVQDLVRLHVACLLGLSIELKVSGDREEIERARALYGELERELGRKLRESRK